MTKGVTDHISITLNKDNFELAFDGVPLDAGVVSVSPTISSNNSMSVTVTFEAQRITMDAANPYPYV